MNEETEIMCNNCRALLPDTATPCPKCGGIERTVSVKFMDCINILHNIKIVAKDPSKTGKKKVQLEFITGHDKSHSGEIMHKERLIDKKNNRYFEKVINSKGEVIREADEKLKDHQGHGSAKFKKSNEQKRK